MSTHYPASLFTTTTLCGTPGPRNGTDLHVTCPTCRHLLLAPRERNNR